MHRSTVAQLPGQHEFADRMENQVWWYCLKHNRVEPDKGCPNSERLGPFETEDEASHAFEIAKARNEEWDAGEDEWGSGDTTQEREV